jgi:DNA-directed RNA polymerase
MKNLHKNSNYKVKFPIYIDATCSGIQHFTAMLRDIELAGYVNLLPQNEKDFVDDFYSEMLEYINQEIRIIGNEANTIYSNFKNIVLTRDEVKTSIMTKTYNVTLIGIKHQLTNKLEKITKINIKSSSNFDRINYFIDTNKDDVKIEDKKREERINYYLLSTNIKNEKVELDTKDLFKIAQIIEKSLFKRFPKLSIIYNYFIEICRFMNSLGLPVN